jgi:hypothetical protein
MRLYASADLSAPNAQAGENRGEIAAHKYEGITKCQRTIPRARKTTAMPQSAKILQHAATGAPLQKASKFDEENANFVARNEPVRMDKCRDEAVYRREVSAKVACAR